MSATGAIMNMESRMGPSIDMLRFNKGIVEANRRPASITPA
jgi:hypothetical protein